MREVSHCTPYDVPMDEDCYRLSTGSSIGSNERLSTTTVSDCSLGGDLHEGERPVSLISTVSLGSCSSWEGQAVGDFTHHLDLSLSGGGSRGRAQPLNTSTTSMSPNPKLTYVDRVVMEIIETERMYVKDLRNIVEDYLAHIIDTNDLPIQPEQVCALFGNIEDIYEFNSELLQSMEECDYAPVAIAHCFVHRSQYFDIYTQYCTNYPNSVATLTECMRNTILAKFFRDRQASLKLSLPLGSYLLKPVQRILKYHLLLQEIAKHFDPEEEGYDVVEEALYTMTGVAWYINDMKRKHEHAVRLQEIQSLLINWKGPDLTTYGELVLEGVFRVHRAKNERTFFLFDRMLLITKKRGEDYVYKTHILCSTLMLVESAKDSLCFSVTHYKHPKQPHTVQARTIEEKRLWAHHIKRLILENHHAIIPEKAKEAILEMDSVYPKYRYHRDRLKGCAPSCEDCISAGRVGQGVSDPTKHIFRSSKVLLKDEEGNEIIEENKCVSENNQTQSQETAVAGLELNQAASDGPLGQTNYVSEFGGKFDMSKTSDAAIFGRNVLKNMPSHSDKVTPTKWFEREPEKKRAGAKTLSSGESSEEEHKSERAASCRIRPSSVLNQASIIVEHFSSSTRRASGISEDQRLLSSPGPRLASRTSSSASLSNDVLEKVAKTGYSTREDLTVLSQGHENLPEVELAGCHRRRDSSLSKQDQLLIDKIKSYYEHAEQEDGGFGLKRRESLTFIPAGLVQNSIIRLNGNPKDDAPSNTMQCNKGLYITSSDQEEVVTFSRVDSKSPLDSPIDNIAHNLGEITLKEEEFHPFIDMIRIWKEMERDVNRSQEELRVGMRFKHPQQLYKEESSNINKIGKFLIDDQATNPSSEALKGLGLVDLRTIVEESFNPSHVKDSEGTSGLVGSVERVGNFLVNPDNCGGFESANKLGDVFQEEDMGKNKVLQLARQYSQRLKGVKPSVIQKTQETEKLRDADSMFWQQEEKWPTGDEGKLSQAPPLMPLLTPFDYMFLPKLSCVAQPSPAQQECSLSESPECFSWPDVQQLRSRYIPHVSLVSQRCSRCSLHLSTDTSPEIGRERKPCQVVVQEQVAMATRSCHMTEADMAAQKVGDDNYVQICSSTTQDNISIMTVVDHSKAYKETEKKGRTQAGPPAIQVKEHVQDTGCGQQSVLKNLREKFLDTKPNF